MDIQQYRAALRIELSDLDVGTWEDDTLDQAVRQALEDFTDVDPDLAIQTVTFTAAVREISLPAATFPRLIDVLQVWLPYTAADPEHPPAWRANFQLWPGPILYIADDPKPALNDVARIWYTRTQTITNLDAAAATTVPAEHTHLLVTGATSYAASARARDLAENVTAKDEAYRQIAGFAFRKLNEFRAGLNNIRKRAAGGFVPLPIQRRIRVPRQ